MYDHIENTRCLIDFDGTIANSLVWYNGALDEMLMGKLTDKHYIEHYKDFGDAYEIIPGSPWKRILSLLCRYLAKENLIGAKDSSNPYLPITYFYDLGTIDAMLCVAYDAKPVEHTSENIYMYKSADGALIGCVLDMLATSAHVAATIAYAEKNGYTDWKMLIPNEYVGLTSKDHSAYDDRFIYMNDVENALEAIFEQKACQIMSGLTFEQLGIAPVIEFCRRYKQAGGSLVIQSGSNKKIVVIMLDTLGIADLFDGVFCSPDLKIEETENMSPWTYKTLVMQQVMDNFADGRSCFVMGDTKGDAFGAYENALPFYLCWRGYPADPSHLTSAEGALGVEFFSDISQDLLDEHPGFEWFEKDIEKMMAFADAVGAGSVEPPRLSA